MSNWAAALRLNRRTDIYMSSFIAGFAAVAGLIALARRRHGTALAAIVLLIVNLIWLLRT
jgi:hypothetical protein